MKSVIQERVSVNFGGGFFFSFRDVAFLQCNITEQDSSPLLNVFLSIWSQKIHQKKKKITVIVRVTNPSLFLFI